MAQFDVHRYPGGRQSGIAFVVIVQSARYDAGRFRLVVPLVSVADRNTTAYPRHLPRFTIEGRVVVADPLLMSAIRREALGPVVTSLADDASGAAIISAIDEVITRGYG